MAHSGDVDNHEIDMLPGAPDNATHGAAPGGAPPGGTGGPTLHLFITY